MQKSNGVKRVLGIDPGYGRLGWAVLEGNRAKQQLVDCGCFETKAGLSVPQRLRLLFEEVVRLVEEYRPDEAGVEDLFFFKNQKTVMQVGQARGAIVVALMQAGVPTFDYTPLQVKQSVTGYGRADKKQVETMVKGILGLKVGIKPDDAADAVAVALTHFFMNRELK
jgi:crossover junction endodeoxyribonuclease RuvC